MLEILLYYMKPFLNPIKFHKVSSNKTVKKANGKIQSLDNSTLDFIPSFDNKASCLLAFLAI